MSYSYGTKINIFCKFHNLNCHELNSWYTTILAHVSLVHNLFLNAQCPHTMFSWKNPVHVRYTLGSTQYAGGGGGSARRRRVRVRRVRARNTATLGDS